MMTGWALPLFIAACFVVSLVLASRTSDVGEEWTHEWRGPWWRAHKPSDACTLCGITVATILAGGVPDIQRCPKRKSFAAQLMGDMKGGCKR